jgi:hypothetical protein
MGQCAAHPQDASYPKNIKLGFSSNCMSILQTLDHRTIRSFKHYYCKQLVRGMFSVIDHKVLHSAMMHYIPQQNHGAVSHMTSVNHFQIHGFNLNEIKDSGVSTELSIAKDDWSQLRTGASYEECVSCNDDMHELQT